MPIAVLLWLTTRRPRLRIAGQPGLTGNAVSVALFRSSALVIDAVTITTVVELGDDLIVGYRSGQAGEGHILLSGLVRDARVMQLLHEWRSSSTRLMRCVSED